MATARVVQFFTIHFHLPLSPASAPPTTSSHYAGERNELSMRTPLPI